MKILFYLGLNRKGQKQQEVIDIPDYEANEWITFGLTQGYKVDENLPIQKQVQKIVDKSYEEMYNADRKEFYHTRYFGIKEDKNGKKKDELENLADESPNQLEQMIEAEESEIDALAYKEFMENLNDTQVRRLNMKINGMTLREIAKAENVTLASIQDSFDLIKMKYKKYFK